MKLIIAIDPGASGSIVTFNTCNQKIDTYSLSDDSEVRDLFESLKSEYGAENIVCYLEQVGGFVAGNPAPGSAMFNFGDGYGYVRGVIDAARIRRNLVRPQVWQKGIPGIVPKMKGAMRKRALKEYSARLYPALKVTLKTADALAILEYARRIELGGMRPAKAIPVASDFKQDAKAAVKWCKANNYEVPPKNGKDFLAMVNWWVKEVKSN